MRKVSLIIAITSTLTANPKPIHRIHLVPHPTAGEEPGPDGDEHDRHLRLSGAFVLMFGMAKSHASPPVPARHAVLITRRLEAKRTCPCCGESYINPSPAPQIRHSLSLSALICTDACLNKDFASATPRRRPFRCRDTDRREVCVSWLGIPHTRQAIQRERPRMPTVVRPRCGPSLLCSRRRC